jgi:amino-acid N-acetyltransferase
MLIRKANIKDVSFIQDLINTYAKEDAMLPRSLNEIYENLRDFTVVEIKGKVIACCSLHILWEDLAEIKSLAVQKKYLHKGYGKKLVQYALKEALEMKIKKVFVLTYIPEFFGKLGFKKIKQNHLPKKVWAECIKCVKFPNCDEVPLVYSLNNVKKNK